MFQQIREDLASVWAEISQRHGCHVGEWWDSCRSHLELVRVQAALIVSHGPVLSLIRSPMLTISLSGSTLGWIMNVDIVVVIDDIGCICCACEVVAPLHYQALQRTVDVM